MPLNPAGYTREEVMDSMYGRLEPKPHRALRPV